MATLNYREAGAGPVLILIHGFPLNLQVWDSFAAKLSRSYHVVTPDLPGFGKSSILPKGFSIDDVAESVLGFITERKYHNAVAIGHSLGGYVTLAMAKQQPDLFAGICLFHSTALADSTEKKQSRDKVLEFIDKQGVQAFTSNFIGPLYANPQHASIPRVRDIAMQASREAVEGYTRAMRDRRDRTDVISAFPKPILLLGGEMDQGIPPDSLLKQVALNSKAEISILANVGHMGMFEAEDTCLKKISGFAEKCLVTNSG